MLYIVVKDVSTTLACLPEYNLEIFPEASVSKNPHNEGRVLLRVTRQICRSAS
jgi:hypothetical protein